jgi:hypothetical protein
MATFKKNEASFPIISNDIVNDLKFRVNWVSWKKNNTSLDN